MELNNNENKKNTFPMKYLAIGAVAVLGVGIFALTSKTTINVEKYIEVGADGYDGYGKTYCYIDWDELIKDYGEKLKVDREKLKQVANKDELWEFNLMSDAEIYEEVVEVTTVTYTNHPGNVSNGDKIEYSIVVDDAFAKCLSCNIKEVQKGTYKINGLQSVRKVDVFENLEVSFDGTSPEGWVTFEYTGDDFSEDYFETEKEYDLKNGEEITVKVADFDEYSMDSFVRKFGFAPKVAEKTYVVSGLEEYVDSYEDLSETYVEELKTEAETCIKDGRYGSWNLESLDYSGYMFSHRKEDNYYDWTDSHNDLYLIYKATFLNKEENWDKVETVIPVRFAGIRKTNDGYEGSSGSATKEMFDKTYLYDLKNISGYENNFDCYLNIKENHEKYEIELGGEFEVFNNYTPVSNVSELDDDLKQVFYDDAKKLIEKYIDYQYSAETVVKDLKLFGEIFKCESGQEQNLNDAKINQYNSYTVVYSAVLSSNNGAFDTVKVYYPMMYSGLVKLSDGTVRAANLGELWGFSNLSFFYHTWGYINGSKMYQELVGDISSNDYVSESIRAFK